MQVYIVMEHNWDDGMIFVTPYAERRSAVEHYRATRRLWSGHGLTQETKDEFFLVDGRMECRVYEEELHYE